MKMRMCPTLRQKWPHFSLWLSLIVNGYLLCWTCVVWTFCNPKPNLNVFCFQSGPWFVTISASMGLAQVTLMLSLVFAFSTGVSSLSADQSLSVRCAACTELTATNFQCHVHCEDVEGEFTKHQRKYDKKKLLVCLHTSGDTRSAVPLCDFIRTMADNKNNMTLCWPHTQSCICLATESWNQQQSAIDSLKATVEALNTTVQECKADVQALKNKAEGKSKEIANEIIWALEQDYDCLILTQNTSLNSFIRPATHGFLLKFVIQLFNTGAGVYT